MLKTTVLLMMSLGIHSATTAVSAATSQPVTLTLKSTEPSSSLWGASYLKPTGLEWISVSSDDGDTWTAPQPWTYDDGNPFFSPSACSYLLKHSSGRYFWIGNISPTNPKGNDPRYPLVIGEVDGHTLKLIKSTVLQIDTKRANEQGVNFPNMSCVPTSCSLGYWCEKTLRKKLVMRTEVWPLLVGLKVPSVIRTSPQKMTNCRCK